MGAQIIEVIKTDLTVRGQGTDENPKRCVTQYWTCEGRLLWEDDPDAEIKIAGSKYDKLEGYSEELRAEVLKLRDGIVKLDQALEAKDEQIAGEIKRADWLEATLRLVYLRLFREPPPDREVNEWFPRLDGLLKEIVVKYAVPITEPGRTAGAPAEALPKTGSVPEP